MYSQTWVTDHCFAKDQKQTKWIFAQTFEHIFQLILWQSNETDFNLAGSQKFKILHLSQPLCQGHVIAL